MDFSSVSFDWFILGLRVAFIGLIFAFLAWVARASIRELVVLGQATGPAHRMADAVDQPVLEVLDAGQSSLAVGSMVELLDYTTVGRARDNAFIIDDAYASQHHAELVFDDRSWWLVNLGATNGSYLNGKPIEDRARLSNGDVVQFGGVHLRVHT
jgi:hypothetical protein